MTTGDRALPTHPTEFGDALRRMREEAGVGLDDIVEETKISPRVLQALESGAFGYLPEPVFSRNFVAQYAIRVGADPDLLTEAFGAAWERYQLASGSHPSLVVVEPPPSRSIRWGFWIPIALGVVVVMLVAVMIVRGWTRPPDILPPDPRRSTANRTPSPTAAAQAAPSPAATVATPPAPAGDLTVDIAFEVERGRECWVYYRDRDGRTDQRLLSDGERLALSLAGPVTLTVGNAGAVSVIIAGTRYEDLGGFGEVVHARVGGDGWQRLRGGGPDGG